MISLSGHFVIQIVIIDDTHHCHYAITQRHYFHWYDIDIATIIDDGHWLMAIDWLILLAEAGCCWAADKAGCCWCWYWCHMPAVAMIILLHTHTHYCITSYWYCIDISYYFLLQAITIFRQYFRRFHWLSFSRPCHWLRHYYAYFFAGQYFIRHCTPISPDIDITLTLIHISITDYWLFRHRYEYTLPRYTHAAIITQRHYHYCFFIIISHWSLIGCYCWYTYIAFAATFIDIDDYCHYAITLAINIIIIDTAYYCCH